MVYGTMNCLRSSMFHLLQYPGVAEGIDSDLNNLVTLMNATKLFPDSLFLDEIVRVARKELAWEVDYFRYLANSVTSGVFEGPSAAALAAV